MRYSKILYIGEDAKDCLYIIEQFNANLTDIENEYLYWFANRPAKNSSEKHDRLKNYIYYHFEGGIAVFNFRHEDELPAEIKNDCIAACAEIAFYEPCLVA